MVADPYLEKVDLFKGWFCNISIMSTIIMKYYFVLTKSITCKFAWARYCGNLNYVFCEDSLPKICLTDPNFWALNSYCYIWHVLHYGSP